MTVTSIASIPHNFPPKAHHHGPNGGFQNPWASAAAPLARSTLIKTFWNKPTPTPVPADPKDRPVQVLKATFSQPENGLHATWLGHASWILQFPSLTVCCDLMTSERTSPVTFMGPKRYSPPPCSISDLPFIDIVTISHSHYDHCDISSLQQLWAKQKPDSRPTFFFVPLGLKKWVVSNIGVPDEQVHEMDWYEGKQVGEAEVFCTPAQHTSGRTPLDKDVTLWCSWTFRHKGKEKDTTCFFAGDTGYRQIPIERAKPLAPPLPYPGEQNLADLPTCPIFEHLGETFDIDLALLPIGLFNPIQTLSTVHCSPWDAVEVALDLKAKKSCGMHFGTVRGGLSGAYEPIDVPLIELEAACKRKNITYAKLDGSEAEGTFGYVDIGQTITID